MLVSKSEYAKRRGVTLGAVCNAIRRGVIVPIGDKIDPAWADFQWEHNRRRQPKMRSVPPGPPAFTAEAAPDREAVELTEFGICIAVKFNPEDIHEAVADWVGCFPQGITGVAVVSLLRALHAALEQVESPDDPADHPET
jgi:hypothetical protein